jgi:hypothetical protein
VWDEGGVAAPDGPIGLVVLSQSVRAGYSSPTIYTHGSLLRTVQEIFGVGPLLRDAANARNLSELFLRFP